MALPARRIAGDGVWFVRDSVSGLQLLVAHETCEFRVEALYPYRYEKNTSSSARAAKRSLSFQIGTRNIIALIQRGIRRFERRGRVGVWGIIRCEGTTYGDREVVWGVYHSPGRGPGLAPWETSYLALRGPYPTALGPDILTPREPGIVLDGAPCLLLWCCWGRSACFGLSSISAGLIGRVFEVENEQLPQVEG
ncbi:hypothetical protein PG995_006663 [Apiospora arundinis]